VVRDGTFHIDDVPTGEFKLSGQVVLGMSDAHFSHHFVVPPIASGQLGDPLDLGVLTLREK
jgi:hypothetical protein